jgi:EAL domain-containing protein (putative c-di-GMP-specific phosphodiesterase class I)
VKALNDVANGLSKQVVAEWIESPEVLKLLVGMGTQYGQGYLFQNPVPLEDTVLLPVLRPVRASARNV